MKLSTNPMAFDGGPEGEEDFWWGDPPFHVHVPRPPKLVIFKDHGQGLIEYTLESVMAYQKWRDEVAKIPQPPLNFSPGAEDLERLPFTDWRIAKELVWKRAHGGQLPPALALEDVDLEGHDVSDEELEKGHGGAATGTTDVKVPGV